MGKNQEAASGENVEAGKRRSHAESESDTAPAARKRKSEGAPAERTPKSQSKAKTRNARNAEWLPAASPRKPEERGAASSASSDDDGVVAAAATGPQAEEGGGGGGERSRSKTKGTPPSKKYNGVKEKSKAARQAAFWEVPEKRPKVSGGGAGCEDQKAAAAVRPKGQKDVWSSIQAQWPKKTLKELFSDSDTEAANSPPPPPLPPASSSCPEEEEEDDDEGEGLEGARGGGHPEDEEAPSEGPAESDKLQEFPSSSGSNSVLNTPPTTPESPPAGSGGGGGAGRGTAEDSAQQPRPSPPHPHPAPAPASQPGLPSEPASNVLLPLPPPAPLGATREEAAGVRSETDSSTVEVESLGGELQELLPSSRDDGGASPSKAFDVGLSCSSSSCGCSHELSGSSQQESEPKSRGKKK